MSEVENPRAVVGDNRPPASIFDTVSERIATLVATANRWATERPVITDEEMAGRCSDFLDQVKAELDAVEKARKDEKQPHLDAAAAVDKTWNPLKAPLEVIRTLLNPRLTVWLNAKKLRLEQEQREREKIAEEARQRAIDAQREAAAALEKGGDVVGTIVQADAAAASAAAAERAVEVGTGAKPHVKGSYGTRAKALRTFWYFEVDDQKRVPRRYLTVDEKAINAAIRAADDPATLQIPGINIKSRQVAA